MRVRVWADTSRRRRPHVQTWLVHSRLIIRVPLKMSEKHTMWSLPLLSIHKLSPAVSEVVKYVIAIPSNLSSSRAAMHTVKPVCILLSNNLVKFLSAASQSALFLMDTSCGAKCPLDPDWYNTTSHQRRRTSERHSSVIYDLVGKTSSSAHH